MTKKGIDMRATRDDGFRLFGKHEKPVMTQVNANEQAVKAFPNEPVLKISCSELLIGASCSGKA